MGYTYFEYGDGDVIARQKDPGRLDYEIFVGGKWEPRDDFSRFHRTANRMDDAEIADWKRCPGYEHAFDDDGVKDSFEARMKAAAIRDSPK